MKRLISFVISLFIIGLILTEPVSARGRGNPGKYKPVPTRIPTVAIILPSPVISVTPPPPATPTSKVFRPLPTIEIIRIKPSPTPTATASAGLNPTPTMEIIYLPAVAKYTPTLMLFPFRFHWWAITPFTNLLAYFLHWA